MEEREQKMYDALKRISSYTPPEKLRKNSQRVYGLDGDEAIEMAYENVIQEAKIAIRGMKRLAARKDKTGLKKDVSNSVDYAQSTPSLCFGYSTSEPQAQAGEPRATAWVSMQFGIPYQATTDGPTAIRWRKAGGDVVDHITLQSHREAMAEQHEIEAQLSGQLEATSRACAEKDAALKACVEALEYHTEQTRPIYKTEQAIAKAQEALK